METREISLISWTKGVLDDGRQPRWKRTYLPVSIFNHDQGTVKAVLEKFDEAVRLEKVYKVDDARRVFATAETLARNDDNLFLAALICNERACNYNAPDTCIKAYEEAAELCRKSLEKWVQHMWDVRAKRAYARPILEPQETLLAAIEDNIEQYRLLHGSDAIRARRHYIEDQLLGERENDRAEHHSQLLLEDVHRLFGRTHWWAGVVLTFIVRAQYNLGKHDLALRNVAIGEQILNEWCVEKESLLQPYLDELLCLRKASLNPLP